MFVGMLVIGFANAQETSGRVGVNIEKPKATLDIESISSDTAKGLLIPRLTGDELKAMTTNLGAEQHSMLVFVTAKPTNNEESATDYNFENVDFPAYYRFVYDATQTGTFQKTWVRVEPTGLEKITENGKTGYRLIGQNVQNYGNIGDKAIDLSFSDSVNDENGATGDYAFAIGINNIASGKGSFSQGTNNKALGAYAFALGQSNTAEANISFAFGNAVKTTKNLAVAMGNMTTASGIASLAVGRETTASGSYSIAMGNKTTASSFSSVALGTSTIASGYASLAMGTTSEARAPFSTAMGINTISNAGRALVIGSMNYLTSADEPDIQNGVYNDGDFTREAFVIGNGGYDSSNVIERSNAFIVLRNGKTGIGVSSRKPNEMLEVNGAIIVGTTTNGCTDDNRGAIKYENDDFYGCKSSGWVKLNP